MTTLFLREEDFGCDDFDSAGIDAGLAARYRALYAKECFLSPPARAPSPPPPHRHRHHPPHHHPPHQPQINRHRHRRPSRPQPQPQPPKRIRPAPEGSVLGALNKVSPSNYAKIRDRLVAAGAAAPGAAADITGQVLSQCLLQPCFVKTYVRLIEDLAGAHGRAVTACVREHCARFADTRNWGCSSPSACAPPPSAYLAFCDRQLDRKRVLAGARAALELTLRMDTGVVLAAVWRAAVDRLASLVGDEEEQKEDDVATTLAILSMFAETSDGEKASFDAPRFNTARWSNRNRFALEAVLRLLAVRKK